MWHQAVIFFQNNTLVCVCELACAANWRHLLEITATTKNTSANSGRSQLAKCYNHSFPCYVVFSLKNINDIMILCCRHVLLRLKIHNLSQNKKNKMSKNRRPHLQVTRVECVASAWPLEEVHIFVFFYVSVN